MSDATQTILAADPTKQGGVQGLVVAESAQLMALLMTLNASCAQYKQQVLETANQAACANAASQRAAGIALAVGAGLTCAVAVGAAGMSMKDNMIDMRKLNSNKDEALEEVDKKLRLNKAALNANGTGHVVGEGVSDEDAVANGPTRVQKPKEQLQREREETLRERDDVARRHDDKIKEKQNLIQMKSGLGQMMAGSMQSFGQSAQAGQGAKGTEQQALNQIAQGAEKSMEDSRQGIIQTGKSFNQIDAFAATVAAARG